MNPAINEAKSVFVFDLDGTLVNTAPTTKNVLHQMLVERGGTIKKVSDVGQFLSTGGKDIVREVLGAFCNDLASDLVEFRARLAASRVPPSDIYPGISDLLKKLLENNNRLAVCTNKPQNLAVKTLEDVGLIKFFSTIVGSHQSRESKPNIEMLVTIQQTFECQRSEMVLIGDSEIDQEAAHNACIDYVHFNHGYGSLRKDITMPKHVFPSPDAMVYDCLVMLKS